MQDKHWMVNLTAMVDLYADQDYFLKKVFLIQMGNFMDGEERF